MAVRKWGLPEASDLDTVSNFFFIRLTDVRLFIFDDRWVNGVWHRLLRLRVWDLLLQDWVGFGWFTFDVTITARLLGGAQFFVCYQQITVMIGRLLFISDLFLLSTLFGGFKFLLQWLLWRPFLSDFDGLRFSGFWLLLSQKSIWVRRKAIGDVYDRILIDSVHMFWVYNFIWWCRHLLSMKGRRWLKDGCLFFLVWATWFCLLLHRLQLNQLIAFLSMLQLCLLLLLDVVNERSWYQLLEDAKVDGRHHLKSDAIALVVWLTLNLPQEVLD